MSESRLVSVVLGKGVIEPSDDIDIYKEVDHLRMERMRENSVWLAGYTEDESDHEYNFWISEAPEGLSIRYEITTRVPLSIFPEGWSDDSDGEVECSKCTWASGERKNLVAHYAVDHEETYADAVEDELDIRPWSLDIHDELA